jgi:hypothetical protein
VALAFPVAFFSCFRSKRKKSLDVGFLLTESCEMLGDLALAFLCQEAG